MDEQQKGWIWSEPGRYDRWTAAEACIYYERYNDLLDLVVVRCQVKTDDRVLDIGTGTGELARRFARNRGCRVIGLDPLASMVDEARHKAGQGEWGNVCFRVVDTPFLEIPYQDETFDAVASTQAFHHLPEYHKPAAVREMARVLCKGGRLAIGDVIFHCQADLKAALARWPEELEEECFAYLETLQPMFREAGLSIHAEQLSRANWVVWGSK